MALRDEMQGYIDGNGLVTPSPCSPGTVKGSDNGTMYTSEYYVMLQKLGQLTPSDCADYARLIGQCINDGLLNRVPIGQQDGQDSPDDYYGVLNGCKQLKNTDIPRTFLKSVFKYKGALNNVSPGTWSWRSFLIRQPQLLACMVAASFPSWKNPLHILTRLVALPLFIYTAIAVGISCIGTDVGDTDSRRLSWHVSQCVAPVSLLVRIAKGIWLSRLYRDYGASGMQGVAWIYYYPHGQHPFSKYWVTE